MRRTCRCLASFISFATYGSVVVAILKEDIRMKIALVAEQASQLTPARGTAAADSGSQGLGLSTLARPLG